MQVVVEQRIALPLLAAGKTSGHLRAASAKRDSHAATASLPDAVAC